MQLIPSNQLNSDYKRGIKAINTNGFTKSVDMFKRLMEAEEITDIQIYGPDKIFLKRMGQYQELTERIFQDETELITLLNRILEKSMSSWKQIPENPRAIRNPKAAEIDTRLYDGSRINITIPPISDEVTCTIAKFKRKRMTMRDILQSGSLTDKMASFLTWSVDARLSILITGETGSGKTTLLQALAQRFGYERPNEAVIVIEDTPELLIESEYTKAIDYWKVVHNEDGIENGGSKTLSDLVKTTLRRRMDRIVISEVRGEEAFYMVDANNTGTTGTLCTLHANSAREAVFRLQNLCLRSGAQGITMNSVARDIGTAFQLIVHQTRDNRGRYIIKEIIEISIEEQEKGPSMKYNPIFKYDEKEGVHKHVGMPSERLQNLAIQRAMLHCPKEFSEQDKYDWE